MATTNLGLPLITSNNTADVVRDMNALANGIDGKAGVANGLATLDTNALLALANIPGTLTGKDADTVDGAHAGTGANNVLKLDSSGKVPSGNLTAATTAVAGIVQLNNTTSSTLTTQAATANAVKTAYDLANGKYTKPVNGIPKADLDTSVQTSLGKADTALQSVPSASTVLAGIVQLVDSTSDTSTNKAATANAVKLLLDWIKSYGLGTAPAIITDANALSAIGDTGFYNCSGSTLNMPAAATSGGALIHNAKSTRPCQIFQDYQSNITYTRTYSTSGWTAWEMLLKDSSPTNLTLQNGATVSTSRTPKYLKVGKHVTVQGEIANIAVNTVIATLPTGNRPAYGMNFRTAQVSATAGQDATILVGSDGTITVTATTSANPISLNGITFIAEG